MRWPWWEYGGERKYKDLQVALTSSRHLWTTCSFPLCRVPDDKQEENKENTEDKENEKVEASEEEKSESKPAGEDGKENEKEEKENNDSKMEVDNEAKQTEKRFVLVSH